MSGVKLAAGGPSLGPRLTGTGTGQGLNREGLDRDSDRNSDRLDRHRQVRQAQPNLGANGANGKFCNDGSKKV